PQCCRSAGCYSARLVAFAALFGDLAAFTAEKQWSSDTLETRRMGIGSGFGQTALAARLNPLNRLIQEWVSSRTSRVSVGATWLSILAPPTLLYMSAVAASCSPSRASWPLTPAPER